MVVSLISVGPQPPLAEVILPHSKSQMFVPPGGLLTEVQIPMVSDGSKFVLRPTGP